MNNEQLDPRPERRVTRMPSSAAKLTRRAALVLGAGSAAGVVIGRVLSPPSDAAASSPALWDLDDGPLQAFNYQGVRLNESLWARQQADVLEYYLRVPVDNWLRGFRLRAGKPAGGEELGGWYSGDFFNPFGQVVSGLARLHQATGRDDARDRVLALIDGFTECIEEDGFFFYSRSPNAPHYGYDKVLCGLLDAWQLCGSDAARTAMDRITAWAIDPNNLDRTRPYGFDPSEWYTLAENLYRAYLATGDIIYREFGKVWEYRGYWDHFYHERENFFQRPDGSPHDVYHAYSHVNTLSGLGGAHQTTGDPYYLKALRNSYDIIRRSQTFATGGYGPHEELKSPDRRLADLQETHWHFETQCGSWAVAKVSKWLLQQTGEARFGDWFEQMLYNGVGASIQMDADGRVQYYSDYSPHPGWKRTINAWSCCTGTRPQVIADYTDLVFLHGPRELNVNLFLPATGSWDTETGPLEVRIETDFPDDATVELIVGKAPEAEFALRFRVPEWVSEAPKLRVNGRLSAIEPDRDGWVGAHRRWRAGDVASVTFPMRLRLIPFAEDQTWPVAIAYGPMVLAFEGASNPVAGWKDPAPILNRLRKSTTTELRWSLAGQPGGVARPFYTFAADDKYRMYLDPDADLYPDFVGYWSGVTTDFRSTPEQGSTMTAVFDGDGLRIHWYRFDDAGLAQVEVDGAEIETIDQYGPDRNVADHTDLLGLGEGVHTIVITCTGQRREESLGTWINVGELQRLG